MSTEELELDFSEYHPLDHWPGRGCRGLHGGVRLHLRYAWEFRWRSRVARWTLCRIGRHEAVRWCSGPAGGPWTEDDHDTCLHCYRQLPVTES